MGGRSRGRVRLSWTNGRESEGSGIWSGGGESCCEPRSGLKTRYLVIRLRLLRLLCYLGGRRLGQADWRSRRISRGGWGRGRGFEWAIASWSRRRRRSGEGRMVTRWRGSGKWFPFFADWGETDGGTGMVVGGELGDGVGNCGAGAVGYGGTVGVERRQHLGRGLAEGQQVDGAAGVALESQAGDGVCDCRSGSGRNGWPGGG